MNVLELDGVTKQFGEILAVDEASFAIEDGEFVSVLGPSGSGKSTILRMIAGFEEPTSGSISMRGDNIVDAPPFERDVNMVFQSLALFPHLSVAENIGYGLKRKGVPKQQRQEQITEMLAMVDLAGYGNRNPSELSGGEQQRVALARALVNKPEVVLFDEPLASLDRKLRQHMQVELQRIQSETDITFLYVTHDQEVALSVSDRLVLLNEGSIEQMGSVEELYEDPASPFVADFIGDVNNVRGTVGRTSSTGVTVTLDSESITFNGGGEQQELLRDCEIGDELAICIRPHAAELNEQSSPDSCSTKGRITNRMYMGNEISYILDTELGEFAVTTDQDGYSIGDEVFVTWSPQDVHVFPETSHERLPEDTREVTEAQ